MTLLPTTIPCQICSDSSDGQHFAVNTCRRLLEIKGGPMRAGICLVGTPAARLSLLTSNDTGWEANSHAVYKLDSNTAQISATWLE
ncbi:hypothetical protein KIN20_025476 [Parelaphostrongylus tenuis]|uniref:Uncharacterized protein n=1 Tax=Parelaphostrongylus tenuis TaxID=148309 RepID=A0AAD5NAT4_PARTN|nr:hypothetical protein KIN20_025476 [Parelaphostrongylus tenuis]